MPHSYTYPKYNLGCIICVLFKKLLLKKCYVYCYIKIYTHALSLKPFWSFPAIHLLTTDPCRSVLVMHWMNNPKHCVGTEKKRPHIIATAYYVTTLKQGRVFK